VPWLLAHPCSFRETQAFHSFVFGSSETGSKTRSTLTPDFPPSRVTSADCRPYGNGGGHGLSEITFLGSNANSLGSASSSAQRPKFLGTTVSRGILDVLANVFQPKTAPDQSAH
jgi:hypothetical protein